jgi:hypothetical protein
MPEFLALDAEIEKLLGIAAGDEENGGSSGTTAKRWSLVGSREPGGPAGSLLSRSGSQEHALGTLNERTTRDEADSSAVATAGDGGRYGECSACTGRGSCGRWWRRE